MAKEKKFTAQTVRVPHDLEKPLGHLLVDTGETFQGLVMRLIRRELAPKTANNPQTAAVTAMPGIFEGLSNDEIWLVHQLASILRERPQGDVFAILNSTLDRAVKTYVANERKPPIRDGHSPYDRSTPEPADVIRVIKGRPKTEWLAIASRVLDSPDPDLVDALTSNLRQFGKDDEALRQTGRDFPDAGSGNPDHQGRLEELMDREAGLEQEVAPETPAARPARGSRARVGPVEKRHLPPTGSGGKP